MSRGGIGANSLTGGQGDDRLDGGAGNDAAGGEGNDEFSAHRHQGFQRFGLRQAGAEQGKESNSRRDQGLHGEPHWFGPAGYRSAITSPFRPIASIVVQAARGAGLRRGRAMGDPRTCLTRPSPREQVLSDQLEPVSVCLNPARCRPRKVPPSTKVALSALATINKGLLTKPVRQLDRCARLNIHRIDSIFVTIDFQLEYQIPNGRDFCDLWEEFAWAR